MSARGVLRLCRQCWDLSTGDNACRCGALAPVLSVGGASEAIRALADLRELLWPGGTLAPAWSLDTITAIARRLDFLRPEPPPPHAWEAGGHAELWRCKHCGGGRSAHAKARPVLHSVPR